MDREKTRLPFWLQATLFILILVGIYYGRQYYIDYKHPYKDLDIIGTWDYGYSVTFDVDEKMVRTDKDLFSLDMYADTEIVLNDDGSFNVTIEDVSYSGIWKPDEHVSSIFHLIPDDPEMRGIIRDDGIRWDRGEDKLVIGLHKDAVPEKLQPLFRTEEQYRYIFCKTYRDNIETVYRAQDESYDDEEWDNGDNGLPFNYHP